MDLIVRIYHRNLYRISGNDEVTLRRKRTIPKRLITTRANPGHSGGGLTLRKNRSQEQLETNISQVRLRAGCAPSKLSPEVPAMWLDDPFRSVIAATILIAAAVVTIVAGMSVVDIFV
jgi:hypothetical protein